MNERARSGHEIVRRLLIPQSAICLIVSAWTRKVYHGLVSHQIRQQISVDSLLPRKDNL